MEGNPNLLNLIKYIIDCQRDIMMPRLTSRKSGMVFASRYRINGLVLIANDIFGSYTLHYTSFPVQL